MNQNSASQTHVEPVTCPFTIAVDTREQSPFHFLGFRADSSHRVRVSRNPDEYVIPPLFIPTVVKTLKSGDYAIDGMEPKIAVERKSLSDLFGTLGAGRERFVRELERLSEMDFAAIVIESDCGYAMAHPPANSRLPPKSVFRSINAWEQEFPTIHWHWMSTKQLAEHKTFRILERYWNKFREKSGDSQ